MVNQIFQVLLPWYILVSSDSILWLGVAGFATIAPSIFSSLWGGSIIDKIGRSKTMLFCETLHLFLIGAIPVLILFGKAKPWLVSAIIFISGFFDEPGQMARKALLPSYTRLAGMPLHKATGLKEALDGIMSVIGPLAAGLVISIYGPLTAWFCTVFLCFLIVMTALRLFNGRKPRIQKTEATYLNVWQNLYKDKFLFKVITLTLPLFILGQSWELLILPAYVHNHNYTSVFLGMMEAAFGLGAFAGALYFTAAGKRFKFFTISAVNYTAYGLSVLVLMFNLPKSLVVAATALCGAPYGAFTAMVITIILSRVSEQTRGKTLGVFAAGAALTESVFILVIALLLKAWGLFNTLYAVLIVFAILILAALLAARSEEHPSLN